MGKAAAARRRRREKQKPSGEKKKKLCPSSVGIKKHYYLPSATPTNSWEAFVRPGMSFWAGLLCLFFFGVLIIARK
jgi:hypothetical protein